jgi:hypothetical protein
VNSLDQLIPSQRKQFTFREGSPQDAHPEPTATSGKATAVAPRLFLELWEIEDGDGKLVYEIHSHLRGLYGKVFLAGTTTVVGELCQHYLDMDDKVVEEALSEIMGNA